MNNFANAANNGETLPIDSLRLLAPPLRLVSAAMWKVMQQRDVMHYGKLEEFVTSVSETVPGLLSYRHQAKLTVGLQARLILEKLRASQSPDPEFILSHLKRLRAPTLSKGNKKDQKVEVAVKNFHSLVQTLLKNPEGRRRFFQEEFDSQYGPNYESALQKLLWEFLTRLDQLLPVPDLAQTVSWITGAPAVLEECARAASQPQLLRTLLQHEKCLGHLDSAASIPSSSGDSILSSLSLPPSGRVQHVSNQSGCTITSKDPSPGLSEQRLSIGQTRETLPQITPVIGLICSKDLPQSTSANEYLSEKDMKEELVRSTEISSCTRLNSSSLIQNEVQENIPEEEHFGKMMRTDICQIPVSSEVDDEAEFQVRAVTRRRKSIAFKKKKQSTKREMQVDKRREGLEVCNTVSEGGAPGSGSQEDRDLASVLASCMQCQLRVVIPRLDIADAAQTVLLKPMPNEKPALRKSPRQQAIKGVSIERLVNRVTRKRKLSNTLTPEKLTHVGSPGSSPLMPARMDGSENDSSLIQSTDDIVIDSEDEATQDVRGKLFKKHYQKTKSDTYIPTLHEFWQPPFFLRDLVSPGNR